MRKLLLALALLIGATLPAAAQGCGPSNPNCIVPTAPAGTCDNRAASTQYACTAGSALVAPGIAKDLPMYNNAGTGLVDSTVPLAPAGVQNLYASPTGNDTNNTCMASGSPCTLKGACSARVGIATFLVRSNAIINLADGTYNSVDGNNALCTVNGNQGGSSTQLTTIIGNCSTPANVILAIPAGDTGIFTKDGGEASLQCATITGGNGSFGVSAAQFSIVDLTNITWGAWGSSGRHISASLGGVVNVNGETFTANIGFHAVVSGGSNLNIQGTLTINSAVVWGNAFLSVTGATANLGSATFAGAGVAGTTGPRTILTGPGYLYTGGTAVDTFIPGSVASSITQGFQTDAVDLQTDVYNLKAASVANAKLVNSSLTVAGHSVALGGTQAIACADLSNGGTACAQNIGTSGANVGLLNANNTINGNNSYGGNNTHSGTETFSNQIISTAGLPTIASGACGTTTNGAVISGSTNQSGSITIGAAATTTCTITWSATLAIAPNACVFFPMNAAAAATGTTVARSGIPSTTQVVLTGAALANANYGYICL
jgi:hypothetical protein